MLFKFSIHKIFKSDKLTKIKKGIIVGNVTLKMVNESNDKVVGYISEITVVKDNDGKLDLLLPSRKYKDKNGNEKYSDIVIMSKEFKQVITKSIEKEFETQPEKELKAL